MAIITVSLEDVRVSDASEIINIPVTIEVTADIELPEIWGFRGQTIGYGRPFILGVEFDVALGIGSTEANRAMEKHLADLYEIDQAFQDRIYALILKEYYEEKKEAEIDAYEAERRMEA